MNPNATPDQIRTWLASIHKALAENTVSAAIETYRASLTLYNSDTSLGLTSDLIAHIAKKNQNQSPRY